MVSFAMQSSIDASSAMAEHMLAETQPLPGCLIIVQYATVDYTA